MRKLENHSLLPVWLHAVITGIFSFIILIILFNDVLQNAVIFIWIGFIINLIFPIFLCVAVYMLLLANDMEKLLEYDFYQLLKRYLPFYSIPFAFVIILLLFIQDPFYYEFLIVVFALYFIALSSLISFIKSIKDHVVEIQTTEIKIQTD